MGLEKCFCGEEDLEIRYWKKIKYLTWFFFAVFANQEDLLCPREIQQMEFNPHIAAPWWYTWISKRLVPRPDINFDGKTIPKFIRDFIEGPDCVSFERKL